jgi:hypothetical protein
MKNQKYNNFQFFVAFLDFVMYNSIIKGVWLQNSLARNIIMNNIMRFEYEKM